MICLCANCHERADKEKWGEKTLREYKKNPWILRKYDKEENTSMAMTKLELIIDMEIKNFDENNEKWLKFALAGFLNISPNKVRLLSKERGSTKVTLEIPMRYVNILVHANNEKNPELKKFLNPLLLLD